MKSAVCTQYRLHDHEMKVRPTTVIFTLAILLLLPSYTYMYICIFVIYSQWSLGKSSTHNRCKVSALGNMKSVAVLLRHDKGGGMASSTVAVFV